MDRDKLIKKAAEFEKKNKQISWKPKDFPEDMQEDSTLYELWNEGDCIYEALEEAVELIHDLVIELEFKQTEE